MAVSGSIPFFRHRLTTENRRSPSSSVTCGSSSGTGRISSHSAVSSFTLSRAPWASAQSNPALAAFFWSFHARSMGGSPLPVPCRYGVASAPFSWRLILSHWASTASVVSAVDWANTWGWRRSPHEKPLEAERRPAPPASAPSRPSGWCPPLHRPPRSCWKSGSGESVPRPRGSPGERAGVS